MFQHSSGMYFYKLAYADIPKENDDYSVLFQTGAASCLSARTHKENGSKQCL